MTCPWNIAQASGNTCREAVFTDGLGALCTTRSGRRPRRAWRSTKPGKVKSGSSVWCEAAWRGRRLSFDNAWPVQMSSIERGAVADSPAAVGAFVRGVERRAVVLAELQAGDSDAGDAAVVAASEDFSHHAAGLPLAQWPNLFWSTLLARPELRAAGASRGHDGWARLGSGPRATLLLRLAAGLGEADAAQALGISTAAYRLALQHALPHAANGQPDPQAWQELREQVHQRIKTLPVDRVQRLARLREQALHGPAPAAPVPSSSTAPRGSRRLLRVLWSLFAVCVLAFVATFVWPKGEQASVGGEHYAPEPLGRPARPAARYSDDAAWATHRDFGLVADVAATPLVRELEFYSWLAAQITPGPTGALGLNDGGVPRPLGYLPAPVADGNAGVETADAPL